VKTPILGQSYVVRSPNAAAARLVNLYPEALIEGKEAAYLQRCPGLRLLANVGSGPIRGLWAFSNDASSAFVVSGNELYKISTSYTATLLGTVAGTGPVSMADNGTQLFIAANGPSYIYNNTTDTFAQITDPDFPGAVMVSFLDQYFVFNEPNSQRIWVTELLDGTSIDPLDFASAEGSPDGVVSLIVDHREVWVFGTNSVEVWYNTGAPDFPLQRIQGAFNELGCAAPYSVAKLDNTVFWLGADARGQGVIYRANGYNGQRVSTHAIEFAIQGYGTISDAVAYSYQQDGHSFYVITFPTVGKTWVYDAATQAWHERASGADNQYRHRSNCQMAFNNEVIVGDYQNGKLYAFDLDVYADDGAVQKWLRAWRALPPGQNNLKRTAHHSLQLDAETGVGLNVGQGSDPQVMLRWSDDGGHNWSNEHWRSMGKIGEFGYRTIWRRLGMTLKLRDRVYEVSGTDPVKIAIMGAELLLSPTDS
jgi:hypothetical protein